MELVTDPKRVSVLAEKLDDENWEFRTFLKHCDGEELDSTVNRLHEEVASQIDCLECGNCCRELSTFVTLEDVADLSSRLRLMEEEVINQYLDPKDDEEGTFVLPQPCPLLSGNECTVYGSHPLDCRSYPHLHKKDFAHRLIKVIDNCLICPIAFNVFERLKAELWQKWKKWEKTEGAWLLR